MASTAIQSSNEWVNYCNEHAIEVSSYVESLKEDGCLNEIQTGKKSDIPTSKLKELENFLSKKYIGLQEFSEARRQVCTFISCKVRNHSTVDNDKKRQSKRRTAKTEPDDQRDQINYEPEKKNIKEEKRAKGKHWLPCNYCFA